MKPNLILGPNPESNVQLSCGSHTPTLSLPVHRPTLHTQLESPVGQVLAPLHDSSASRGGVLELSVLTGVRKMTRLQPWGQACPTTGPSVSTSTIKDRFSGYENVSPKWDPVSAMEVGEASEGS